MKKITSREREQLLIDLGTDIQLILVKIDAGSFMMGSPEGELGKGYNETLHQVVLTKDYWIGQYPVTQRQ
ncbi:MAG: SUMF1/EgtB/PvdO family nonheme iron enzyme, partial [Bacteroidaceae bacterium]|nr:SUMF1/EgtB/PvdO family nonheme iron enzyme [Bacteroidaceae bacterium]